MQFADVPLQEVSTEGEQLGFPLHLLHVVQQVHCIHCLHLLLVVLQVAVVLVFGNPVVFLDAVLDVLGNGLGVQQRGGPDGLELLHQ